MEAFAENYGQNSVNMGMSNGGRNTKDENMKILSRQRSVQAQTPSHQQFEINRSGSLDTEIEDSTKVWNFHGHLYLKEICSIVFFLRSAGESGGTLETPLLLTWISPRVATDTDLTFGQAEVLSSQEMPIFRESDIIV